MPTAPRIWSSRIGVSTLKVGSGDLTNAPLLLHLARFRLPIILSTGMATLAEVEQALGVIAFGYLADAHARPSPADFANLLLDRETWTELRAKVTLLHCTTEYPAEPHSINLRAMATLHDAFGLPVGFSDHSRGIHVAAAAVALGAAVIEKHLTLDRNLPGPDHRASIEPDEMAAMIAIDPRRRGGARRRPQNACAGRDCRIARWRGEVSLRSAQFAAGERFTEENLGVKRPGDGISPIEYWSYLGKTAHRDYAANEALEP